MSQTQTIQEAETAVKEAHNVYNSALQVYNDAERNLYDAEYESFKILQALYESLKASGRQDAEKYAEEEKKYQESLTKANNQKFDIIPKQKEAFVSLQKLFQIQVNYLVSVINSQDQKIKQLEEEKNPKPPVEPSTGQQ